LRRRARGVATYLQTFVLLSVVLAGSYAVYSAVDSYVGAPSPSISLGQSSLRQGGSFAVESLAVTNTGDTAVPSLTLRNPALQTGGSYCWSLFAVSGGSVISNTCPTLASNPTVILDPTPLSAGSTVILQVEIAGGSVFTPGSSYPVVVSTPSGAQAGATIVAVAA
jgi:hypothetical protein